VTSVREAQLAVGTGADLLVLQGAEAGGHQGSFVDLTAKHRPLLSILAEIRASTSVPLIATGGIMSGRDAAALKAGAIAVQIGTALLCTPEAGTSVPHREALLDERYPETIITRAYSGRFARGLANRLAIEHDAHAPSAYPEVHHLTPTAPNRRDPRRRRQRAQPLGRHRLAQDQRRTGRPHRCAYRRRS
jgi:nitronate monooxygenase